MEYNLSIEKEKNYLLYLKRRYGSQRVKDFCKNKFKGQ
jgi:hypothetical protein